MQVFATFISHMTGEHGLLRAFIMLVSACSILAGMWRMRDFVKEELTGSGEEMDKKHIPDVLTGAALIFLAVAAIAFCGEA